MRLLSMLTAAGLMTTGLAVAAPAAQAAPNCTLLVPSRLSIGTQHRTVTAMQGSDCVSAKVIGAAWYAYYPSSKLVTFVGFENSARSAHFDLADSMPLGRWVWQPHGAYYGQGFPVPQNTAYSTVRLASYGRVVATRTGAKVNVKTTAGRYWQSGHKFIRWSGARGQIQWKTPGTTTWHGLKDVYSSTTGAYSYTYTTSASREYRVVLTATSTIWESTSPVVRK